MAKKYSFKPDYAIAPGETLKEVLESKCISQSELARRAGITEKTVSQIISGAAAITYEVAAKLELALGVSARFWNSREMIYRESIVRLEESRRLESAGEWLKLIPVKTLMERGFLKPTTEKVELVREVLKFFGVSGIEAWHLEWGNPAVQYRGGESQKRKPGYVAAWLRLGDLQAEAVETKSYDASTFRRALLQVRALSTSDMKTWFSETVRLCGEAGVVVVLTKEIDGAGVSGATRWLSKGRALIQLSLKFKSDDQVIFTFFHEAGHILLHGKKSVFIEFGTDDSTPEEAEANQFARDLLIPPEHSRRLPYLKNRVQICDFARQLGITPGLVVGRLQYDRLVYQSAFNDLKRKLAWEE